MDRGYVIQANTDTEFKQAELLCDSIKTKNKDASVTLITRLEVESESFDNIKQYAFHSLNETRQNDYQLYWSSPYDYTIAIDCRSIVMENQDALWEYLIDHHSICFPMQCKDYRMSPLYDKKFTVYREDYKLRKVYSSMFYFDKSEDSLRYFKLLDPISKDWRDVENSMFAKQHISLQYEPDMVHTIVANRIDVDVFPYDNNVLSYIDMRTVLKDGMLKTDNNWTSMFSIWSTNGKKLKLQNYAVNSVLYYHEDEFYKEEMANDFRNSRKEAVR